MEKPDRGLEDQTNFQWINATKNVLKQAYVGIGPTTRRKKHAFFEAMTMIGIKK